MSYLNRGVVENYEMGIQKGPSVRVELFNTSMKVIPGLSEEEVQVYSDGVRQFVNKAVQMVLDMVHFRSSQPMLDILVRDSQDHVCISHLKPYSVETTKKPNLRRKIYYTTKSSIADKLQFTYLDQLYYTLQRCFVYSDSDSYKSGGALIDITVFPGSTAHSNMVYLNYLPASTPDQAATVELYLFDPNGVNNIRTAVRDEIQRGWSAVATEWNGDRVLNQSVQLKEELSLLGGKGVQIQLGVVYDCGGKDSEHENCKGLSGNKYLIGDPICGAVTYWMFSMWLSRQKQFQKYMDFERTIIRQITRNEESRMYFREQLHTYIAEMRLRMEQEYHDRLKTILKEDMKVLSTTLSSRSSNSGVKFTISAADFNNLSFRVVLIHPNPLLSTSLLVQFDGTRHVLLMSASEQCGNQLAETPAVGASRCGVASGRCCGQQSCLC